MTRTEFPPATFLTAAQRAAARLIVHLQASDPGPLTAAVEGDTIVLRYGRKRPYAPPAWEGFRVDVEPDFRHPDHGWEAFLTGEPGHLPAGPRDDSGRMGA